MNNKVLKLMLILMLATPLLAQENKPLSEIKPLKQIKMVDINKPMLLGGFVKLKSGKTLTGKLERKTPLLGKTHYLLNDTLKVYLNEILELQDETGFYVSYKKMFGSYSLAKRVAAGKIELFSDADFYFTPGFVNTVNTPGGKATFMTGGSFSSTEYSFFRKPGGEVLETSYSNLTRELADNPLSMEHLSSAKTNNYLRWGTIAAGVGIIVAALSGSSKDNPPSMGTLLAGGLVANLSWIFNASENRYYKKAIEVYNK